jgi:hypothetical protein
MDRSKAVAIKSPHDAIKEDEPADTSELLHEAQFLEACGGHPSIISFHGIVGDYVTDKLNYGHLDYIHMFIFKTSKLTAKL